MFIIVIGIIALVIGVVIKKADQPASNYSGTVKIIGIALIVGGALFASIKQIEPGDVGVQKLFGKVDDKVLVSGLNFINPLVEVVIFDIRTQNYTMSAVRDEGDVSGDDAIRVLSADGLEVVVDLTVLYKVLPTGSNVDHAVAGVRRMDALRLAMQQGILLGGTDGEPGDCRPD